MTFILLGENRIVIGGAIPDEMKNNPGQFMRRGSDRLGHPEPGFHPAKEFPEARLAAMQAVGRHAQDASGSGAHIARFGRKDATAGDSVVRA